MYPERNGAKENHKWHVFKCFSTFGKSKQWSSDHAEEWRFSWSVTLPFSTQFIFPSPYQPTISPLAVLEHLYTCRMHRVRTKLYSIVVRIKIRDLTFVFRINCFSAFALGRLLSEKSKSLHTNDFGDKDMSIYVVILSMRSHKTSVVFAEYGCKRVQLLWPWNRSGTWGLGL